MVAMLTWVAFGAVVGCLASLLLKTDDADRSTTLNVIASVAGALFGGVLAFALGYGGRRLSDVLSFQGVLFAGVGAAALLVAVNVYLARHEAHA